MILRAARDATPDHRAIHQAAVERDPLATEVAGAVLANPALGIANLVLLFGPQLVVLRWETTILPPDHTERMRLMDSLPEFNIAGGVGERLARIGVKAPQ